MSAPSGLAALPASPAPPSLAPTTTTTSTSTAARQLRSHAPRSSSGSVKPISPPQASSSSHLPRFTHTPTRTRSVSNGQAPSTLTSHPTACAASAPPTPVHPSTPIPHSPSHTPRRRRQISISSRNFPESGPSHGPIPEANADLQRNARRSKVEAMSKLDRAGTPTQPQPTSTGTSFIPPPQAGPSTGPGVNPLKRPRPQPPNPPFDLTTVRTAAPRHPDPPTTDRAFGLQECPSYHPTAAEFTDPMTYIESIAPEAKRYGMCKIVPPEGWQMPFSLDPETFRFQTRLQKLNSIEAASRAKLNFLEQLSMYHFQQGDSKVTIPIIDRRMLDLWLLRREVNKLGGVDEVNRLKAWPQITAGLGFDPEEHTQVVRSSYVKIISPFESFVLRARSVSASPAAKLPVSPQTPSRPSRMGSVRTSPRTRMSAIELAPAAQIKVPGFSKSDGSESELSEDDLSPEAPKKVEKYEKGEVCEICNNGNAPNKILLCDGCDRGFHTYCLNPPLTSVPANDEWFCTACLLGRGDDYGFDEGEEHSLSSFQARDNAFTHAWFNRYSPFHSAQTELSRTIGHSCVSEQDIEKEFWRLVESQDETVEIEYGADVHSTTHGSAAPTLETHPTDPYAKSPWNLNNMPIVKDSLLRYIKSDISGMTVPWIYVGMLFSTFCWHNEDHYTYSVNYMFWGETKTWYGVPGDGADKFEAAMKREAPELFEAQPSLLFQLVTMMNPGRLKAEGVPVYACDQRPNEFVITFPKAYHCGFNHGMNFNEAVNFALPDWLEYGRESVVKYKQHLKAPVFSHSELLITITLYSDTIKTALWLQDGLRRMVEEECKKREAFRATKVIESLSEEDVPEEQYQCCVCKGFCYLSQVTCTCTKLVTCIDHADQLCNCGATKTLRKRYSENQLEEILEVVVARASIPQQWRERLEAVLESPRPQLKSMRALVTDGERISFNLPELADLRDFVNRATAWTERASGFGRKNGRRRKREDEKSLQVVEELLQEADVLAFDSPEIGQIKQLVASIESFRAEAAGVIARGDELGLDDCRTVLILGESLNVDLPEINELSTLVNRLAWHQKIEEEVDDRTLQYDEIVRLLKEGEDFGVDPSHRSMQELRKREEKGRKWKTAVETLLEAEEIDLDKVDELLETKDTVPVLLDTLRNLEAVRKTATTWQTNGRSLLSGGTVASATRLCRQVRTAQGALGRIVIPEIAELQAELDFTAQWQAELANVFNAPAPRLNSALTQLLAELETHLDPSDTHPNETHDCFCRLAGSGPMATCTSCEGRYHLKCVGITAKAAVAAFTSGAQTGFQCQMCEHLQYDDRPSVHALAVFSDPSRWSFLLVPPELDTLDRIVELCIQYASQVVPVIDPHGVALVTTDTEYVAHLLRKVWTLPITLDAVNAITNERIVLEDWLYRRLWESKHPRRKRKPDEAPKEPKEPKERKRARRPKLVLAGAREAHEFACLCTTPPLDALLTVECGRCGQGFHQSCARAPLTAVDTGDAARWRCPFCVVKEGKHPLKGVDLRVQMSDQMGTDQYVDWRATMRQFAAQPITITIPPSPAALVLECIKFVAPFLPEGFVPPPPIEEDGRKRRRKSGKGDEAGAGGVGTSGDVGGGVGDSTHTIETYRQPTSHIHSVHGHKPAQPTQPPIPRMTHPSSIPSLPRSTAPPLDILAQTIAHAEAAANRKDADEVAAIQNLLRGASSTAPPVGPPALATTPVSSAVHASKEPVPNPTGPPSNANGYVKPPTLSQFLDGVISAGPNSSMSNGHSSHSTHSSHPGHTGPERYVSPSAPKLSPYSRPPATTSAPAPTPAAPTPALASTPTPAQVRPMPPPPPHTFPVPGYETRPVYASEPWIPPPSTKDVTMGITQDTTKDKDEGSPSHKGVEDTSVIEVEAKVEERRSP